MKHNVIFIIAVLLSWAGLLRAADDGRTDCVTALPVQVVPGGQAVLQLWLQGDDGYEADGRTYRSLQFDLVLPKGITLIENEASGEYQYTLGSLFSTGTNVSIAQKDGDADANRYRFIIYNVLNTRFTAPSGALLSLWLQADADVPTASQLTATIEGQILGQTGDTNVHAANQPVTLTTAGYVKGERGRGVYTLPYKTSDKGRDVFGNYEMFFVLLDQAEALQKDGHAYRSAQFDLHLPQGMHLRRAATEEERYITAFTMTNVKNDTVVVRYHEDGDFYRVLIFSNPRKSVGNFGYYHSEMGDSSMLWVPEVVYDSTFVAGMHTIRIDNQVLGVDADKSVTADPSESTVTHDMLIALDETRTSAAGTYTSPVAVDPTITMKAGEWRSFSLPMTLSEEQVKEAFGEDVKLAVPVLTTIPSLTESQLKLNFQTQDVSQGIQMLEPYLICPSKNVTAVHFDNVMVKPTAVRGTPIQVLGLEAAPQVVQGAMVGSYLYADTLTRFTAVMNTTSQPNFLVMNGEQFYADNTADPSPLNAFHCIFFHRAINNLLKNLTDVAYVEPQTEIDLTFEDGQTKTVRGQVVTEGDKQYVAVGKTRYEVLETLGKPVGDVNSDKTVTIADVTALVNIILGKSESPGDVADVNGDHSVTIADVTALVNIILGKTEGGVIGTGYKVRNVSPVVGYVDGEEVITWGGSADGQQE